MGALADLLAAYMREHPDTSVRQVAERSELPFETFRKILLGRVVRPQGSTLEKISQGTGIPMSRLRAAVAREVDATYQIQDITTREALAIAIARVGEVPEDELEEVARQAALLLAQMKRDTTS